MRNELIVTKLGIPVMNKVLIEVTDTFEGFKSKGGLDLINYAADDAWADIKGYNISEFVIRHGKVIAVPDSLSPGSFDYKTIIEIMPGDDVYWNSISFKEHIPIVYENRKFLLVDYHEILFINIFGELRPINGNVLLNPIQSEEKALEYVVKHEKTDKWIIYKKPAIPNIELNEKNKFTDIWFEGDVVYLSILDKPFKVEGDVNKQFDEDLYCCPLKMVLCSIGNINFRKVHNI